MRGRRSLAAAALLAGPLIACAPPPQASAPRGPRLVAHPGSFDLGRVRAGTTLHREFRLRNAGDAELRIEAVESDCGCAVVGEYLRRLPPGGATSLRVRLEAPVVPGSLSRQLQVRSNDPARPALELGLRATVVMEAGS